MRTICIKAGIKFPERKISHIERILSRYLTDISTIGYESKDRRFLLTNKRVLIFQSRFRQISMPLNKTMASLSLTQPELYSYLVKKAGNPKYLAPFSLNEKILIKNLVRLSGLQRSTIPCIKIRSICR